MMFGLRNRLGFGGAFSALAVGLASMALLARHVERKPEEIKITAPVHPHRHRASRGRHNGRGGLRGVYGAPLLWRP